MSKEHVEVVQRVMRRFADQNIDAALEDIDSDAVLDWSNSDAPDSGVYRGHAAWRTFMQGRDDALGHRHFDTAKLIAPNPETVLLAGSTSEQGRTSGAKVEARGAAIWTLRDGKVVRLELYQSSDAALKAVGLD